MLFEWKSRVALAFLATSFLSSDITAFGQTALLQGNATKYTRLKSTLQQQQAGYDVSPPQTAYVQVPAYQGTVQRARVQRLNRRPVVYQTYQRPRSFWARHPMVKNAAIGGGVGAAAGAATGLISHRGVVRGALVGAGTGAGIGMVRTSRTLKRHPYVRDGATGALAGLGLGLAASRSRGTAAATTGIGAAAGLGYRFFKNNMR